MGGDWSNLGVWHDEWVGSAVAEYGVPDTLVGGYIDCTLVGHMCRPTFRPVPTRMRGRGGYGEEGNDVNIRFGG